MIQRTRIFTWLLSILLVLPLAAAAQGYRVSPGDVLRIEVIEDETLNRSVLVDPQGRINFPLAGTILVQGQTVSAVESTLVASLAPNFAAPPSVFVALEQLAPPPVPREPAQPDLISVFVLGEVANPGRIEVEKGTTLLQAFAAMGGFSNFAAIKRVQLRRTNPKTGVENVSTINYDAMAKGLTTNTTLKLREGDVILVPTRRLFE